MMDRESAKTLAWNLLDELKSEDPDLQKVVDVSEESEGQGNDSQKL